MTREDRADAAPELPSSFDAPDRRRARTSRAGDAPQPADQGRTSRAPRVPFAVLLMGLLVGGLALLLLLNTASAANELSRHDLAAQDVSIAAQAQQLQNDVAASAAPANLARAAAELGMVPAADPAFLIVGANGAVTVRGSAAPASAVPLPVPAATKAKAKATKAKSTTSKTKPKTKAKTKTKTKTKTKATATTSPKPKPKSAPATATSTHAAPSKPAPTTRSTAPSPGGNR